MEATISLKPPQSILGNTRTSIPDFFLAHVPLLEGCVCTRFDFSAFQAEAFHESKMAVVVIGCTLDASRSIPSIRIGSVYFLGRETPITFVEQVAPVSFRERAETNNHLREIAGAAELKPIVVDKIVHFSADINLHGRKLDTERVLLGFRLLIDDCLSDAQAKFKCPGCRCVTLKKRHDYCPVCQTVVEGVEVPPKHS